MQNEILSMGKKALKASRELSLLDTKTKNEILLAMADEIERQKEHIQNENKKDLLSGKEKGLSKAMLDRLELTDVRIKGMSSAIREVAALPDPVGETIKTIERPNGLQIKKVRVPIGVIGIIFESRPNVTADSASLCFKTSNAVILRGGKEAVNSNRAIAAALQSGGKKAGLPDNVIQLIQSTERDGVRQLVQMDEYVNLIIPRGGEGLIRAVTEMAHVPVIKHYKGVCHTYVDRDADLQKALSITVNAKCQRPGVCNAMETLLVHQDIAGEFLPKAAETLKQFGMELRGNEAARKIVNDMKEATEEDWYEEYLDLILAVRVVPDIQTAIDHINTYGSQHSDAIITESSANRDKFFREVDSATVYVNASTRFTDGGEFGMGAEIGISTDKLHARGPMGLEELTTYKYIIYGDGQIRE